MLEPGETLGQFVIEAHAATGGMGHVYAARDRDGRRVAIKLLDVASPDPLEPSGVEEERFSREARLLAQRGHPGIVRYLAHGTSSRGAPYLAMEWLEGRTLEERLARSGPLAIDEAIAFGRALAETLGAVHAAGVVHRDVKPGNLFLVDDRAASVKLIDFGLARVDEVSEITLAGARIGTPGYMAPEQVRGDADIDARADVFALGAVLFTAIAGRPPFEGVDALAILGRILVETPPALDELVTSVPKPLARVIARMLAKDRDERPTDGAAAALALADASDGGRGEDALVASTRAREAPRLSERERGVVSVVAVGPEDGVPLAEARFALRRAAAPFGAEVFGVGRSFLAIVGGHGTPRDLAARARRCADAFRTATPARAIALVTGHAESARGARIGEALDRAASMLAGAEAGALVLDDATSALLGAEPITRTLLGKRAPFVGRAGELARLGALVDASFSSSSARAALVTAEAGAGKTRLREELHALVATTHPRASIWTARGDLVGAGAAFALASAALSGTLGLRADLPAHERRSELRRRVAERVGDADASRIAAFLGEILGLAFPEREERALSAARRDPAVMGDQIRRAWEDFVAAACRASPVLIVLDDLHWGDLPSVRLLDAALSFCRAAKLAVIAFARPSVHDAFPDAWSERGVVTVPLAPLDDDARRELVSSAIDGLDESTLARIATLSGGNAFYLEELVRALASNRALPETLVAMTRARLDVLEPSAKRALRAASVFGETFWAGAARALAGAIEPAVHVTLAAQELVVARPSSRVAGEDEYAFRHDLLREAAYAMLTERDRRVGHGLAGAWLEAHHAAGPRALAEHFERGGEGARAAVHFAASARAAIDANDFARAIDDAARGLACAPGGGSEGELLLVEAEARRWRGDSTRAATLAIAAAERFAGASHDRWLAAASEVIVASGIAADYTTVAVWAERAATSGAPATCALIACLCRAATQLTQGDRLEHARRLGARVEELVRTIDLADAITRAWLSMLRAWLAYFDGEIGAYLEGQEATARAFEEAGDERNSCREWINLGNAYLELGAYDTAIAITRPWAARAARAGHAGSEAIAHQNLGYALGQSGRYAEGVAEIERAFALHEIIDNPRHRTGCLMYLAMIARTAGDLDAAERHGRAALASAKVPTTRALALAALAGALLDRGRAREALEHALEGMTILETIGALEENEPVLRLVHAEALDAVGDREAARAAIRVARERIVSRRVPTELRATFLGLPVHARTLELAAAWETPST